MERVSGFRLRGVGILPVVFVVLVCLVGSVPRTSPVCEIGATEFESRCVDEALRAVMLLYREMGFRVEYGCAVECTFTDRITLGEGSAGDALGQFDRTSGSIRLVHFESEAFQSSHLAHVVSPECAYRMVVAHEIAHAFNWSLSPDLHPVLDELIAGYVQFATADKAQVERCLDQCGYCAIRSLTRLSIAAYVNDPTAFLAGGYRYMSAHRNELTRILSGQPVTTKDPFMID
jgi:hypothetical protein